MASPTFRAGSANSVYAGTGLFNTLTIPSPAGVQSGDLLLAYIQVASSATSATCPGWGLVALGANLAQLPGDPSFLFVKTAGPAEPSSYTFSFTSGESELAGIIVAYQNCKLIDSTGSSAPSGSSTTSTAANLITTQPNQVTVVFWVNANAAPTLPGGVTSRQVLTGSAQTYWGNAADLVGPGTPGTVTPGTADTGVLISFWSSFTVTLVTQAPLAPTLDLPVNGAYDDIDTTGGPFNWTYHSGGATGGQTAWHFRRRLSGGSFEYWNNTLFFHLFQGTDVANTAPGNLETFTFPAATWTDGNTYLWSVASEDANGMGPYANEYVLNAQDPPSVSVTHPTGTITTTQTPNTIWVDTLAAGAVQFSYRVVIYSAAQYGIGGFTPGVSPSTEDTGVVVSPAVNYVAQTHLLNGAWRAYVQIVQSPGSQVSPWAFSGWTQGVAQPAAPTLTAVAGNDMTSGAPRIELTATGSSAGSIVILRSDGVYVRGASPANPALEGGGNIAVVDDFEVVPGVSYTYTAQEIDGGTGFYGPFSSATAPTDIPPGQGWWLLDPLAPSGATNAQLIQFNPQSTEQSSAHQVLGQKTMNVLASVVQHTDMTGTFEVFDQAIYTGLLALIQSQRTLWVSDPYGAGPYYFRMALAPGGMSTGTGSKTHDTQLLPSTAAAPHRVVAVTGIAQPRPPV